MESAEIPHDKRNWSHLEWEASFEIAPVRQGLLAAARVSA